jgi:predicted NBD/HSP70 family sugar kinase
MLASHHPIAEVESIIAGPALNRLFTRQANIRSFDEAIKKCKARDARICALLEPVLDVAAAFLYNVILAYDPEIIVIGGGVGTNIFSIFSGQLERKVKALLLRGGYPSHTEIEYSTMVNPGSAGAALYANENC